MPRYRIVGMLIPGMCKHVAFEGSLRELLASYPLQQYPNTLNSWVEDILGGRGGSCLFRLESSENMEVNEPYVWKTAEDPRVH